MRLGLIHIKAAPSPRSRVSTIETFNRGFAMSNAVENQTAEKGHSGPQEEKSGTSTTQMILIGLGILAVAALLGYQFFGCATCYG
jgi:hypothetical protein